MLFFHSGMVVCFAGGLLTGTLLTSLQAPPWLFAGVAVLFAGFVAYLGRRDW